MKSIFDQNTREEIIARIDSLNLQHKAQWGKMTVTQMVRHCALCDEYYFGKISISRSALGLLFGKSAIKKILKDENSSFARNAPTAPQFKVNEKIDDLSSEKENWKAVIRHYATYNEENFVHWFFGKISKEQMGQFIYKHSHHHLQQFGA